MTTTVFLVRIVNSQGDYILCPCIRHVDVLVTQRSEYLAFCVITYLISQNRQPSRSVCDDAICELKLVTSIAPPQCIHLWLSPVVRSFTLFILGFLCLNCKGRQHEPFHPALHSFTDRGVEYDIGNRLLISRRRFADFRNIMTFNCVKLY